MNNNLTAHDITRKQSIQAFLHTGVARDIVDAKGDALGDITGALPRAASWIEQL